jgi:hypothetical protein
MLQIQMNQELVKDSEMIVYNIFTDKDALIVKNTIKRSGIKTILP